MYVPVIHGLWDMPYWSVTYLLLELKSFCISYHLECKEVVLIKGVTQSRESGPGESKAIFQSIVMGMMITVGSCDSAQSSPLTVSPISLQF